MGQQGDTGSERELLAVLAHELRNPLASLQGCAHTLMLRGADLPAGIRHGLTEVIAKQSVRMDWLIRALAVYGGVGSSQRERLAVAEVVLDAAECTETVLDTTEAGYIDGDPSRTRLALEAILLASGPRTSGRMTSPAELELVTPERDLDQAGRRWKLDLAGRLLAEQGGGLDVIGVPAGTLLRVTLGT